MTEDSIKIKLKGIKVNSSSCFFRFCPLHPMHGYWRSIILVLALNTYDSVIPPKVSISIYVPTWINLSSLLPLGQTQTSIMIFFLPSFQYLSFDEPFLVVCLHLAKTKLILLNYEFGCGKCEGARVVLWFAPVSQHCSMSSAILFASMDAPSRPFLVKPTA